MPSLTAPHTDDAYATHLPIIQMVLALVKPRRILELGSGVYSTRTFLECPTLQNLVSLETDKAWADRLRSQIDDYRLHLLLVEDTVEALPENLMAYDLILVDNADNAADRERTIRVVLEQEHPVVILHDAEHPWYRHTITSCAEHYALFDDQVPHTAVCW